MLCRLQNAFSIISKKVIQHQSEENKNGSPCIFNQQTKISIYMTRKQCEKFWVIQLHQQDLVALRQQALHHKQPSGRPIKHVEPSLSHSSGRRPLYLTSFGSSIRTGISTLIRVVIIPYYKKIGPGININNPWSPAEKL